MASYKYNYVYNYGSEGPVYRQILLKMRGQKLKSNIMNMYHRYQ